MAPSGNTLRGLRVQIRRASVNRGIATFLSPSLSLPVVFITLSPVCIQFNRTDVPLRAKIERVLCRSFEFGDEGKRAAGM